MRRCYFLPGVRSHLPRTIGRGLSVYASRPLRRRVMRGTEARLQQVATGRRFPVEHFPDGIDVRRFVQFETVIDLAPRDTP